MPVTSTFACSVPVTSVSAVVKPWTRPRSIGLLSTCRSTLVRRRGRRAVRRVASALGRRALKSAVGRYPFAVMPRRRVLLQLARRA